MKRRSNFINVNSRTDVDKAKTIRDQNHVDYNPLGPENIYLEQLEKERVSNLTLVERAAELMQSYTGEKITLTLPLGMKAKPFTEKTMNIIRPDNSNDAIDEIEIIKENNDVSNELFGLPGSLLLDEHTTNTYFGDLSRTRFFERYQWLNRNRSKLSNIDNEMPDTLKFDNEHSDDHIRKIPFGVNRNHRQRVQDIKENKLYLEKSIENSIKKKNQNRFPRPPPPVTPIPTPPLYNLIPSPVKSLLQIQLDEKVEKEKDLPPLEVKVELIGREKLQQQLQIQLSSNKSQTKTEIFRKNSQKKKRPDSSSFNRSNRDKVTIKSSFRNIPQDNRKIDNGESGSNIGVKIDNNNNILHHPKIKNFKLHENLINSPIKDHKQTVIDILDEDGEEQHIIDFFCNGTSPGFHNLLDKKHSKNSFKLINDDIDKFSVSYTYENDDDDMSNTGSLNTYNSTSQGSNQSKESKKSSKFLLKPKKNSIFTTSKLYEEPTTQPLLRQFGSSNVLNSNSKILDANRTQEWDVGSVAGTVNSSIVGSVVLQSEHLLTLTEDETDAPLMTPRTAYISACMTENINPRPSLLLRRNLTKRLELQYQGMGDEMARLLAKAIHDIPFIQSINLTDNRLSDDGLGPILQAIMKMDSLLELHLSDNEIGPIAADLLSKYLLLEKCPLQRLIMCKADVDDFECEAFIESVKQNKSIKELDLSNNLIGQAENLNTVMPDLITGGEAIADLLRSSGCQLEKLNLAWNQIRLDGAIDLASSLSVNKTITYLDLSYNALGRDGGIALGHSIVENKTLRTLIVANNNLDAMACITLCAAVVENIYLKSVCIDGNPIGDQGAKAIMLLPIMIGSRSVISCKRCNVTIRDSSCPFDPNNPIKDYDLDMTNGFDRAVALLLCHIVAQHQTLIFQYIDIIEQNSKGQPTGKILPIDLVSALAKGKERFFDDYQKLVHETLKMVQLAVSDPSTSIKLFQEIDKDGSGELDKEELADLVNKLGITLSPRRIDEIFYMYDVDQGGTIDMSEFLAFLKGQFNETQSRLTDLTQDPVMVLKHDKTKKRWVPPKVGKINMKVIHGFAHKPIHKILTSCDKDFIYRVAQDAGENMIQLMSLSVETLKMRLDEALSIYETMMKETNNKVDVLVKLLPQITSSVDARQLVSAALQGNRLDLLRLKKKMGSCLKPILGMPNGYYQLDLSNKNDQLCIERLLELSKTHASNLMSLQRPDLGLYGDRSQKGNWTCFRNEMYNRSPVVVDIEFCSPIPKKGKLEFDYSGADRVTKDELLLSDDRFVKILQNNFLSTEDQKDKFQMDLHKVKKHGEKCLSCDGHSMHTTSLTDCFEIGQHMLVFYSNLALRAKQNSDVIRNDNHILATNPVARRANKKSDIIGNTMESKKHEAHLIQPFINEGENEDEGLLDDLDIPLVSESSSSEEDSDTSCDSDVEVKKKNKKSANENRLKKHEIQEYLKILKINLKNLTNIVAKKKLQLKSEDHSVQTENTEKKESEEYMKRFANMLVSNIPNGSKARRIIEHVSELFCRIWFFCRHLALLIEILKNIGITEKDHSSEFFGTYRVDLIVELFSRIVDINNFELIIKILTPFETACLYCRLGWLNLFNPCKPEGSYEMDMSRVEERTLCKMLCGLAIQEPGDNWIYQVFKWDRNMEPMPAWELTQGWLTEDGMPTKGILQITYYSGDCKNLMGCRPNINFRKSLCAMVAINEWELVEEESRIQHIVDLLPGEKNMEYHRDLWVDYFGPLSKEMRDRKLKLANQNSKKEKKKK